MIAGCIISFIVGAAFGMLLMGLCAANGEDDDEDKTKKDV